MQKIWLSPLFDEIPNGIDEIDYLYNDEFYRCFDYWGRAEELLSNKSNSEFDLRDAISNLKKSMDIRFKLLEKIYAFRSIEEVGNKRKYVEILSDYKLIRPLLIESLFLVRNLSEHQDAKPPSIERCNELLDVIWYFLKSTDNRCRHRPESIHFDDFDKGASDFTITYRESDGRKIFINGKVDKKYISFDETSDGHCISIDDNPEEFSNSFLFKTNATIDRKLARQILSVFVARA
ncbi:hypothetical protein [Colwellia sp. C1TZA3]|uniref:hypothetical protein n=1 Tax=Colwellia sp. C1TZA3 TaxID=2508879 RepID=UPI0011B9ACEE|nr:hypothetical protein [Colwellia sp. C1TZA3]TWX64215.1 hypothetical protein ESZ39_16285 [Colwellia sp. C1TZA3]